MNKTIIFSAMLSILTFNSMNVFGQNKSTSAGAIQTDLVMQPALIDWLKYLEFEIDTQQFLAKRYQSRTEISDMKAEHTLLSEKALKELNNLQPTNKEVQALVEQQIVLYTLNLESLKSSNNHQNTRLEKKIEKLSQTFEQDTEHLDRHFRTQLYQLAATQPQFIRNWNTYQYITLVNSTKPNHQYSTQYLQQLSTIKTQDPQLSELLTLKKKLITDTLHINPALSQNPFITISDPELSDQIDALTLVLEKRMIHYFLDQPPLN